MTTTPSTATRGTVTRDTVTHRLGRRGRRGRPAERGSVTAEVALLAPLLVLLALATVNLGRTASTRIEVASAATQGARAASLAADSTTALEGARRTVTDALAANTVTCTALAVTLDLGGYRAGGTVAVTVACTLDLRDLAIPGLPATITVTQTATSPLDRYRQVGP